MMIIRISNDEEKSTRIISNQTEMNPNEHFDPSIDFGIKSYIPIQNVK